MRLYKVLLIFLYQGNLTIRGLTSYSGCGFLLIIDNLRLRIIRYKNYFGKHINPQGYTKTRQETDILFKIITRYQIYLQQKNLRIDKIYSCKYKIIQFLVRITVNPERNTMIIYKLRLRISLIPVMLLNQYSFYPIYKCIVS